MPVHEAGDRQPQRRLTWGLLRTRMRQRGKHGDRREETESLAHGSSSETAGGSGERPRQNSLRGMISCRRVGCASVVLRRGSPFARQHVGGNTAGEVMSMNRRHFLMSTAVMTAGAAVRGLASPNDTVRMGVVGLGGRGSSHINAWSEMPNVELVAISRRRRNSRRPEAEGDRTRPSRATTTDCSMRPEPRARPPPPRPCAVRARC